MNPEMVGEKEKKAALILSFSPREKESLFPRLVNLDALSLRRFLDVAPFGRRGATVEILLKPSGMDKGKSGVPSGRRHSLFARPDTGVSG